MTRSSVLCSFAVLLLLLAGVRAPTVWAQQNRDILIVVDRSASMGELPPAGGTTTKLDILKCMVDPTIAGCPGNVVALVPRNGVIRGLGAKLTAASEMLLLTFGGGCVGNVVVANGNWAANAEGAIINAIKGLTADGLTPLTKALLTAKQLLLAKVAARKQANQSFDWGFVLMSDGLPTCPEGAGEEQRWKSAIDAAKGLGELSRELQANRTNGANRVALQNTLVFYLKAPLSPDSDPVKFARELANAAGADLYFAENPEQMAVVAQQALLNTASPLPAGDGPYAVRRIEEISLTAIIDDGKDLDADNDEDGRIDPGEKVAIRFALDNESESDFFMVRMVADLIYLGTHVDLSQRAWNEVGTLMRHGRLLVNDDHAIIIDTDSQAPADDSFEAAITLHAFGLDAPEHEIGTAVFKFDFGRKQGF